MLANSFTLSPRGATSLGLVCIVVINSRVLSANRVDFGLFSVSSLFQFFISDYSVRDCAFYANILEISFVLPPPPPDWKEEGQPKGSVPKAASRDPEWSVWVCPAAHRHVLWGDHFRPSNVLGQVQPGMGGRSTGWKRDIRTIYTDSDKFWHDWLERESSVSGSGLSIYSISYYDILVYYIYFIYYAYVLYL